MKIHFNGKQILEITDHMQTIFADYLPVEEMEEDLQRRVSWIITHLYDEIWERFYEKWSKKLENHPQIKSIPTDREEFTKMVVGLPEYLDRSARREEEKRLWEEKMREEEEKRLAVEAQRKDQEEKLKLQAIKAKDAEALRINEEVKKLFEAQKTALQSANQTGEKS